jgi:hypothetical protein
MTIKQSVDVRKATHVKVRGQIKKIKATWGIGPDGELERASKGGFGVITEDDERVSMWDAECYFIDRAVTRGEILNGVAVIVWKDMAKRLYEMLTHFAEVENGTLYYKSATTLLPEDEKKLKAVLTEMGMRHLL